MKIKQVKTNKKKPNTKTGSESPKDCETWLQIYGKKPASALMQWSERYWQQQLPVLVLFLCKNHFQFYSDCSFPNLVLKTPLLTRPTHSSSQFTPCWSCTCLALKRGGVVGDKAHWGNTRAAAHVIPTSRMLFLSSHSSHLEKRSIINLADKNFADYSRSQI